MRWMVFQTIAREVREVFLTDTANGRDFMVHAPREQWEESTDDDPYKMSGYLCDNEATAMQLAGELARRDPRVEVYVCQTKSIICSARPTLITKAVTERGVLPA